MHANLCLRPTAEHLPPLVSVVVPCFNGRRFLREAIESALAQCFTPVEVIVVDDGSTDGSREVAECFPSVLIISQSNQGVSVARNAGLHACHGTYVVFLDADDRLHPNAIASHVAAFADYPDNIMVFGGNRLIDEAGTVIGENDQPAFTFHVAEVLLGVVPSPSQSMFRREVLVAAGGFNPFLSHGEDFDLYARLTACGTGRSHGVIVADYRLHSGQATKQPATGLKMVLSIIESRRSWSARAHPLGALFWTVHSYGDCTAPAPWSIVGRSQRSAHLLPLRSPHGSWLDLLFCAAHPAVNCDSRRFG
jgi:glycosyltransferase involved in cell wall biosynthesis